MVFKRARICGGMFCTVASVFQILQLMLVLLMLLVYRYRYVDQESDIELFQTENSLANGE